MVESERATLEARIATNQITALKDAIRGTHLSLCRAEAKDDEDVFDEWNEGQRPDDSGYTTYNDGDELSSDVGGVDVQQGDSTDR